MRVLHVVPSLGPVYGSPSKVVPDLARTLTKVGLTVHIATTNANGHTSLDVPLGIAQNYHGVSIYYFPQQRPASYTFSWPLTTWLFDNLRSYDLVHINALFSYPTFAASRLAIRLQKPYIVCPHGMLKPFALQSKAWKKWPYLKLIEGTTLTKAAALHALTVEEAVHFRSLNIPTPRFIVPNGIEPEEFSSVPMRDVFESTYPQTKRKKLVLYVGRIHPIKGLDLLVAAVARVRRRGMCGNMCLIIVGPDPVGYRRKIEKLVQKEGIADAVLFTGELYGEAKLTAFRAADVFVLPSRSEGFSVTILEALASGLPVLITDECNFRQVVDAGAGLVVSPGVESLAESIAELLHDRDRRLAMGMRARGFVRRRFAWQGIVGSMAEVYADILNKSQKSSAWVL